MKEITEIKLTQDELLDLISHYDLIEKYRSYSLVNTKQTKEEIISKLESKYN